MASRKILLAIATGLLLLVTGVVIAVGQGGQEFEPRPIVTTASQAVGVGTYVAAEAYGIPAGEDPAEQPAQAIILPYGIYPDMGLQDIADFVQPESAAEGFTFEWSLVPPEDSATELISGNVAIFMADVAGIYELTLTATDANGNTSEVTWPVYATTYIGNGYWDGENNEDQCTDCHDELAPAWAQTGHAAALSQGLDGLYGDHFGPDCLACHTTGFNNSATAVNGGFDDLVAESGWTFPETLQPGNWEAMLAEFPQAAGLGNVQCEACHGPGYHHVFESSRRESMISRGLEYGVCAQCHAEEPYNIIPQQWENSAHAIKNARAFTYPIGEEEVDCVRCHSGAGYIDFVNGVDVEDTRVNYQVITCAVCHDPHDVADNPNQLRVFDTVTLPNGTEVAEAGPAATCMSCHNSRRDAVAVVEGIATGGSFSTPHYSTAAELMNATGGYTWGETLPTSTHGRAVEDSCIGCHMSATPGSDADGNPLPGHNEIGGHTFSMVAADGSEHVAVCQQCHDAATSFEFEARRDYDGDGAIETNQVEIEGLLALVKEAIAAQGVTLLDSRPYYEFPEGASVDVYGAAYNVRFAGAGGSAVHNLRYTVSLLQLSYEKLMGEPVPGATILPPK